MGLGAEDVRRLALALPEAAEGDDHGTPAFLAAGKIFCTLGSDRFTIKLGIEDQENLVAGHSGVIAPVDGYWGRKGWTHVRFQAAGAELISMLPRMAWRNVAPKRLLREGP
jgi:hypothetical protein